MSQSTLILGIDPGSLRTGFGLLLVEGDRLRHVNHGVIMLTDEKDFPSRLRGLSESLRTLLDKYSPDMVVVEKIFLGKNAESAFQLGHARGVVLAEACRAEAMITQYATRAVKKGVTGNGGASKEQVQTSLQKLLGLVKLVNFDASDALALAYYQALKLREQAFVNQAMAQESENFVKGKR